MDWIYNTIIGILVIAMLVVVVRLILGPRLTDRIVALDVIAILAASLTAVFAIRWDQLVLLDVTIVLALVSFIGTVAVARYLERQTTT